MRKCEVGRGSCPKTQGFVSFLVRFVIWVCVRCVPQEECQTKFHWSVWHTEHPLLTHPPQAHWLWQVAWRCQEMVISFICESSAQGCALFPCLSVVCQRNKEAISHIQCFSSRLLHWSSSPPPFLLQDRSPYVQVSGQSEIPEHGHRVLQGCDLSSSGGHLRVKGECRCLSPQRAQPFMLSMFYLC